MKRFIYIAPVFACSIDPNDPREGEIEANLQEASKILITIRKKVVDIAAELELQEKNLPLVAQKVREARY